MPPCAPTRGTFRRAAASGRGRTRASHRRVDRGRPRPPRGRVRDGRSESRHQPTGRRILRQVHGAERVAALSSRALRTYSSASGSRAPVISGSKGSDTVSTRTSPRARAANTHALASAARPSGVSVNATPISRGPPSASSNEKPPGATATGQGAPWSRRSVTAPGSTRPTSPRREDPRRAGSHPGARPGHAARAQESRRRRRPWSQHGPRGPGACSTRAPNRLMPCSASAPNARLSSG